MSSLPSELLGLTREYAIPSLRVRDGKIVFKAEEVKDERKGFEAEEAQILATLSRNKKSDFEGSIEVKNGLWEIVLGPLFPNGGSLYQALILYHQSFDIAQLHTLTVKNAWGYILDTDISNSNALTLCSGEDGFNIKVDLIESLPPNFSGFKIERSPEYTNIISRVYGASSSGGGRGSIGGGRGSIEAIIFVFKSLFRGGRYVRGALAEYVARKNIPILNKLGYDTSGHNVDIRFDIPYIDLTLKDSKDFFPNRPSQKNLRTILDPRVDASIRRFHPISTYSGWGLTRRNEQIAESETIPQVREILANQRIQGDILDDKMNTQPWAQNLYDRIIADPRLHRDSRLIITSDSTYDITPYPTK